MNDELIDYYGCSIQTYSDEYCVEEMERILLLFRKTKIINGRKRYLYRSDYLKAKDEKLLINNAAMIFNTFKNTDISSEMKHFIHLVCNYRFFDKLYIGYNRNIQKRYSKKSVDEKARVLQSHISDIIAILGENASYSSGVVDIGRLKQDLRTVAQTPKAYIPEVEKDPQHKQEIINFLKGFTHSKNYKEIDTFLTSLFS